MSDEYMCPFCVTPWKCNGPHIEPEDMAEFEAYSLSQYNLGFRDGLDAALEAVAASWKGWCDDPTICTDYEHVCGERRDALAAIDRLSL